MKNINTILMVFFFVIFSLNANAIPDGNWSYNEGSGTLAEDSLELHNGTLVGTIWSTDCVDSNCVFFDGNNDYIQINWAVPRTSTSISFWINTTTTNQGISEFSRDGYGDAGYTDRVFWVLANGSIGAYIYGGDNFVYGISNITDGNFHNIVVMWNTTAKYLYIDGVLEGSSNTGITSADSMPYYAVGIGSATGQITPLHQFFNGVMDEHKIYLTMLSPSEITDLYTEFDITFDSSSSSSSSSSTSTSSFLSSSTSSSSVESSSSTSSSSSSSSSSIPTTTVDSESSSSSSSSYATSTSSSSFDSSSSSSSVMSSSSSSSTSIPTTTLVYIYASVSGELQNGSWEDCSEYRSFYTQGDLLEGTWEIHSELGEKLGCYLNVIGGDISDSIDGITRKLDEFSPSNLWDRAVNGLDSGLNEYLGFGLAEIRTFFEWILLLLLGIIGFILGLIALYPFLCVFISIFVQMLIIILTFGNTKENPTAWDQLKKFVEYDMRWFGFLMLLSLGTIFIPIDLFCELVKSAWFGGTWDWVSKRLISFSFNCLAGRF